MCSSARTAPSAGCRRNSCAAGSRGFRRGSATRPARGRCWRDEQAARAAKLGLWGEPYYVIDKAEDPAEVLKSRGRFALVEGKVVSVRESGGTI